MTLLAELNGASGQPDVRSTSTRLGSAAMQEAPSERLMISSRLPARWRARLLGGVSLTNAHFSPRDRVDRDASSARMANSRPSKWRLLYASHAHGATQTQLERSIRKCCGQVLREASRIPLARS